LHAQFRIVGGDQALQGQFPWVGDQRIGNMHQCGSSLIAPTWVITAAHCVVDFGTGLPLDTTDMRFRFNSINTNGPINPAGGVDAYPEQIFIHHSFSINVAEIFSKGNDIALVKLKYPVAGITPILLPAYTDTATFYNTGHPVKIAGWGVSDTMTFDSPDTLKYCSTKVYDFSVCGNLYPSLTRRTFCAGFMAGEDAAGAAVGDSGGPVWVEHDGNKKITGLVSGGTNGFTGADLPGVYTKVATFRPWIDSVMASVDGPTVIDQPEWKDGDIKIATTETGITVHFGAVKASDISCHIFNAEGRRMYTTNIISPAGKTHNIDMSSFATGLYIVRFFNAASGKVMSKKIIRSY
jgi:secreted trypsin-like serine protease